MESGQRMEERGTSSTWQEESLQGPRACQLWHGIGSGPYPPSDEMIDTSSSLLSARKRL